MKIIKKYKYYILSFILPLIICIALLIYKGVFKNIETFFVSDLKGQHLSFYNYLKNIILGKDSIHYSYYAGMGSTMIGTLAYYMMSPINILIIIIKDIRYAILFIYITKICLSGLTMYIFLNNKFKKTNYMTIAFSSCYALSSFAINYFFCIFWLDSTYLAPLVLLGIEKIFEKEKINLLYIFSLALAIISNIQMGFGLCVFSTIYYLYLFSIKYEFKKDFKTFKHLSLIFIISSLCAGAISSGVILAIIEEHSKFNLAREVGKLNVFGTSSPDYIIKNLFSVGNLKTDYTNNYEPYIYSGIIITYLSILYFFNDDIPKRKKKSALIVIIIFLLSFFIAPLNYFWHLSKPILINYRYSIYLTLFLIIISYENYLIDKEFVKKEYIALIISTFVGVLIAIIYTKEVYLWESIIFILLILSLLIFTKNISKKFEVLLLITIIIEIFFNAKLSFYTSDDMPFERYSSYKAFKKLDSFNTFDKSYRVSTDYTYTEYHTDMFLLGHNSSLRYFSSVMNGNITRFLSRNSSLVGKSVYIVSSYDSPLLLSLLGNKYFYLKEDSGLGIYNKINEYRIKSYDYKKKKVKNRNIYLYENPYALSLGYVIEKDAKYNKKYDVIDYQNKIIKSFTGNDKDTIIRLDFGESKYNDFCTHSGYSDCINYYIENDTDNEYIQLYYKMPILINARNDLKIYGIDWTPLVIWSDDNDYEIVLIPDEDYDLKVIKFSTYDKNVLIDNLKKLQENMLEDVKINKNIMQAKIDSSKDGILFLSVPYEKKFKIYVDGKKVKHYPLLDNTFMGIDIKKGKHKIKLVYKNNALKWYILSSVISLIITIIIYKKLNNSIFLTKTKKNNNSKRKNMKKKKR